MCWKAKPERGLCSGQHEAAHRQYLNNCKQGSYQYLQSVGQTDKKTQYQNFEAAVSSAPQRKAENTNE